MPETIKSRNQEKYDKSDQTIFIAGDWGTSVLRLYLCQGADILDTANGPGISNVAENHGAVLFDLIKLWSSKYGKVPIYLSGMIGSNIGWINTDYSHCPASKDKLCNELTKLKHAGHDVFIVGGLSCKNPIGATDLMRGEETQILGAMNLFQELNHGDHLLCLPGTHTKWVFIKDGVIETFQTALTGELYALLASHSVLIQSNDNEDELNERVYEQGLRRSSEVKYADLSHVLFEIRSKQIKQELEPHHAQSYLSGLLIGKDVAAAIDIFKNSLSTDNPVTIIGSPKLTHSYKMALKMYGLSSIERDGGLAVVAGLRELFMIQSHKDQNE